MKKITFILTFICFVSNIYAASYYDTWLEKYDLFLKRHVYEGEKNGIYTTLIDYEAIEKDPEYQLLVRTGTANPKRGRSAWRSFSKEKQMAFHINYHNFMAIRYAILNKKRTISDIGKAALTISGAFNRRPFSMAGALYRIRQLSDGDPMIHFALNRGVLSDPPLRKEAYTGENLRQQLEDQLKQYLISETAKQLQNDKKQIVLSDIFQSKEFDGQAKKWLIEKNRLVAFAHDYQVVYKNTQMYYPNNK